MKILVISDNHGDYVILETIFKAHRDQVDALFHCGDSEFEAKDPVFNQVHVVKGNNDYDQPFPEEVTVPVGDEVVYMTHGDRYQVNFGLEQLSFRAREVGATVCFFGHTHQLMVEVENDILYLNPGSISLPRGEYASIGGTYAIVTASKSAFDVDFYNRDQQIISEMHQHFER